MRSFLLLLSGAGATPSYSAHVIARSAKLMGVHARVHDQRYTMGMTESARYASLVHERLSGLDRNLTILCLSDHSSWL